jgi:hypothetical protein
MSMDTCQLCDRLVDTDEDCDFYVELPVLNDRPKLVGMCKHCREKNAICDFCGGDLSWKHDHKPDQTGLDDGPTIRSPRRKAAPKPPEEVSKIRAAAWETRRQKYGPHGHR